MKATAPGETICRTGGRPARHAARMTRRPSPRFRFRSVLVALLRADHTRFGGY